MAVKDTVGIMLVEALAAPVPNVATVVVNGAPDEDMSGAVVAGTVVVVVVASVEAPASSAVRRNEAMVGVALVFLDG